ncbi:biotin--[acetyl-CoA-carboxylase] ligase [Acidithiobacillus caldus]|uniref:biotin--[acetyl-CoA-carboxylase] ligase n=1 Tax=Acidithiobacillus caldus TaxID=33059 RepID=UPI000570B840|nr:biotin--[acetyl-CoA-carboxylase] ligase [Acidithiobacillus caldus]MBU2728726.1 biotin--[acetyl-CoA-carboxylase] ligase [Acidithiobacillus caldus]MBU2734704.1 biotin--[acetyl-CoA-carboxylase] ligase [Acidithiobacillus caldus ATCC 51756]MBU2744317.1 biotin--[acetyl-CoA-carboxylase] ligase [Acidithiobacillus caldus]MBU2762253.1 biotin--[acetyl-CoA-carboxylase] ligase [Acidithiobacillus caldus]MBU2770475.1 biotin--[acetyl-CoA-carboxylase] ligase [Acidithiobacillus caldus]
MVAAAADGRMGTPPPQLDDATRRAVLAEAQRWGLPLSFTGNGPILDYPAEPLDAARIAADAGYPPQSVRTLAFCDSTNTRLFEATGLMLCLAEAQWAGRGRRGRSWYSPFGRHLYLSLRLPAIPGTSASLPLVAALSVHQLLAAQLPGLWVKWPNDLWVGGQKLGGFLLEGRYCGGRQDWVLGMGLNCHLDPSLEPAATCLAEHGLIVHRNELAAAILRQWRKDFALLDQAGFVAFTQRWKVADRLRDRIVEIQQDGRQRLGRALGVDEEGRLQVRIEGHEERLHAADVRIRARP